MSPLPWFQAAVAEDESSGKGRPTPSTLGPRPPDEHPALPQPQPHPPTAGRAARTPRTIVSMDGFFLEENMFEFCFEFFKNVKFINHLEKNICFGKELKYIFRFELFHVFGSRTFVCMSVATKFILCSLFLFVRKKYFTFV